MSMSRSPLFARIHRALAIARVCEARGLSTEQGIALAHDCASARRSRREWLQEMGRASAAAAVASVAAPIARVRASTPPRTAPSVGIVGAGLAGLACADALTRRGIVASVYEAGVRTGGRCWSLGGFFPQQVGERGGEFIDTTHKTMLGYAQRFNLEIEDVSKKAGDTTYFFDGQLVPEAAVVDEFREFVAIMRADLRRLSSEVTAASPTADDVILDNTSLEAYLDGQNAAGVAAGSVARAAITSAYLGEYGLETGEQSCLNFLLFIHADRRSKFTPFGVFSDERYHVVDGNDRIAEGLTQSLLQPVVLGRTLVAARKTSSGAIELIFETGAPVTHDIVVLAMPFSVLRHVALDSSLAIPIAQRTAIDALGYGNNAKLLVGFDARPWTTTHGSGTAYSDLVHHQLTWETNRARASATRGVLTDYASGDRGFAMNPAAVQAEAEAFLSDLDLVFPGAAAAASRRPDHTLVAHLEHWPSNPLTLGSYTCYRPGQFTTIAGLEGVPVENLYFAGEHANSFYEAQGFMEGAALSGLDVAAAILRAVRK
jgi:monoamine oxidase